MQVPAPTSPAPEQRAWAEFRESEPSSNTLAYAGVCDAPHQGAAHEVPILLRLFVSNPAHSAFIRVDALVGPLPPQQAVASGLGNLSVPGSWLLCFCLNRLHHAHKALNNVKVNAARAPNPAARNGHPRKAALQPSVSKEKLQKQVRVPAARAPRPPGPGPGPVLVWGARRAPDGTC